jgi:hypothetical protein
LTAAAAALERVIGELFSLALCLLTEHYLYYRAGAYA